MLKFVVAFVSLREFLVIRRRTLDIYEVKASQFLVMKYYLVRQGMFIIKAYYKYGKNVI